MPSIDEKKAIILPLLDTLKQFNPQIGNYEKSILNEHLQYAVKLHNGRLTIPQETVHDYEQSPAFVTEDQLKFAASTFIPSQITNASFEPKMERVIQQKMKHEILMMQSGSEKREGSTLKKLLIVTGIIVLVIIGYYVAGEINKQKDEAFKEELINQESDAKNQVRNNILSYITAETNQYQYSNLGGIYNLVITIKNPTNYLMENVRVTLTYVKANGDVWRNIDHDFEMLSPNSIGTIKVPDTERGVKVNVRVTAVKSTALGLN